MASAAATDDIDIHMDDENVVVPGAQEVEEVVKKVDPMKDLILGNKHPLVEYMSDNKTKFYAFKSLSEDYFIRGLRTNTWALSQSTLDRLSTSKEPCTCIGLVSLSGSNGF